MIYKQAIQSLITNDEIISKLSFGSTVPIRGEFGLYYILYKTWCLVDGMVYVGAHQTDLELDEDRYLANGVTGNKFHNPFNPNKVCFGSHFTKYGRRKFKKENLLYFNNESEMLEAERIAVDEYFVKDERTLNLCVGGGNPPVLFGKDNGNYGNYWSDERRNQLSKYFIENRDFSGDKNPKARKIICIDCFSENFDYEVFNTVQQAEVKFDLAKGTLSITFNRRNGIVIQDNRYCLVKEEYYNKLGKDKIIELIDNEYARVNKTRQLRYFLNRKRVGNTIEEMQEKFPMVRLERIKTILNEQSIKH